MNQKLCDASIGIHQYQLHHSIKFKQSVNNHHETMSHFWTTLDQASASENNDEKLQQAFSKGKSMNISRNYYGCTDDLFVLFKQRRSLTRCSLLLVNFMKKNM